MRQLQVKVASTISYLFVNSGYPLIQLAAVHRTLLLIPQPTLEQFQLPLQSFEKVRADLFAVRVLALRLDVPRRLERGAYPIPKPPQAKLLADQRCTAAAVKVLKKAAVCSF